MRLENAFEVPSPPDSAWWLLLDVPRVVPCMPGAELTATVDELRWKAKLQVRLGPVTLVFGADVERTEVDEAERRVVLATKARELRGRGAAQATIESSLEPTDAGTRVKVVTDLTLSGKAAQFGGPVVRDVAAQLTREFARCLAAELVRGRAEEQAAVRASGPKPVSGLRLLLRALLARFHRR